MTLVLRVHDLAEDSDEDELWEEDSDEAMEGRRQRQDADHVSPSDDEDLRRRSDVRLDWGAEYDSDDEAMLWRAWG